MIKTGLPMEARHLKSMELLKREYWSMAAGVDLTNWLLRPELASGEAQRSVKLLYRYTDALMLDSASGNATDNKNLVVLLQRKF
jgi:hypothetical protein